MEYKLQLLDPSSDRFARLVTQLKGRLLEGGGQAYYEIGVADSGALIGLPRDELERSLQTLDMMAGEIGASVIVVKEIEVPAVIASIAAGHTETWTNRKKRAHLDVRKGKALELASDDGCDSSSTLNTSTSETPSTSERDLDPVGEPNVFGSSTTDSDLNSDVSVEEDRSKGITHTHLPVDLEISTVFKPRPKCPRVQGVSLRTESSVKPKRLKKIQHLTHLRGDPVDSSGQPSGTADGSRTNNYQTKTHKATKRRQNRDRKRVSTVPTSSDTSSSVITTEQEDHLNSSVSLGVMSPSTESSALSSVVTEEDIQIPITTEVSALVAGLSTLHVTAGAPGQSTSNTLNSCPRDGNTDSQESNAQTGDGLSSPSTDTSGTAYSSTGEPQTGPSRLIVEALVVRKMSLEERFLDFEGFALE